MIRRLFQKSEQRNQPYSDALVSAIQAAAAGSVSDIRQSAALEIAASTISKSFASLQVEPMNMRTECLTPSVLGLIGRELIRKGESLFLIDTMDGLRLIPVASFDVRGEYRETTWMYRVDVFGPSSNTTKLIMGDGVVHCRYSCDIARPWLGVSPLGWSRQTADIHAEGETALLDESKSPRGTLIPISKDGGSDTLDKLKTGLKALRGSVGFVPSQNIIGDGQGLVRKEYELKRLGFNAPATMIDLHSQTSLAVLAACGIPIELVSKADGTGMRESWRRFLFSTINPLVKIVQAELRTKLEVPDLQLKTDELFASDLAGRARAFGSMVQGGIAVNEAAALCGLVSTDD